MRTVGYTLHQSLTVESAAIVKQALTLARRRGHAQVTPLHVASAMLSSSTGLLKRACLQSHSHPLQCKALELCFNVALNRLPTGSGPLLGPNPHLPSLSNALVAAFKRSQAHQRRGGPTTESHQQPPPILALKIEIEQLVISILDDPSVSRVMREAGFNSTQVKANVEKDVSLLKKRDSRVLEKSTQTITSTSSLNQFKFTSVPLVSRTVQNNHDGDDVESVLEAMRNKKTKNTVIVSECSAMADSLVKGLIEKFDKKDVPFDMKYVQFISVPLFTLRNISREEFESKLGELRTLVKSYVGGGVVLYLGDLDWVSEYWTRYRERRDVNYYCPVEYMIMEISRLICGFEEGRENIRLWLMGIASFQTYAKCKMGRPSLETLWSLHRLTVPVGSLALSLSLDSGSMHDQVIKKEPVDMKWLLQEDGIKKQLICCSDCSVNFKKEAQAVMSGTSSSSLPSWLQQYKIESRKQIIVDEEYYGDEVKDLCKKWNSICSSIHMIKPHHDFLGKPFNLSSSSSPSSSTSVSSNSHKKHRSLIHWPVIFEQTPEPKKKHQIFEYENDVEVSKPSFSAAAKPELLSNPNSSPNSASSSEATDHDQDMHELIPYAFNDFSSENLKILSQALEKKVPWQKSIIPEIATTILQCRSKKKGSWLLFLGADHDGKEAIARELAKTVFGSYDDFTAIGIRKFSYSKSGDDDACEEVSNSKRARDEHGGSAFDRFLEAVRDNSSRVFYVEDVEQFDDQTLKGFERVMKDGGFGPVQDAIVIFSCESFNCESRVCSTSPGGEEDKEEEKEERVGELGEKKESCGALLDLNVATEVGDEDDENSVTQSGILGLVDKQVVFKIQVL